MINDPHFILIRSYYGDRCAQRSKVSYMNHINEGLIILDMIGSSTAAKRAFCLHPIVQRDEDFYKNKNILTDSNLDTYAIILAIEYRSVANEYLSHRIINDSLEIRLSPLKDVNDMLIADKIQNYKDFMIYHSETHPQRQHLEVYFNNWFKRLEITDEIYNNMLLAIKKDGI